MAIETEEPRTEIEEEQEEEGGPVKTFLEHLEDLRWVLIKSGAAVAIAMLVCLMAGNHVVQIIMRPLHKAKVRYAGTNQIVTILMATNRLGTYSLTPAQEEAYRLAPP